MRFPRAFAVAITTPLTSLLAVASLSMPALAQNGRPAPVQPQSQAAANGVSPGPAQPQTPPENAGNGQSTRGRPVAEGKVTLAFNDVPVDEKITAFIAEATGKVVMPVNLAALKAKKITLMNDEPVERALALDLLLTALRLNGVGIIETDRVVVIDLIENIKPKPEVPVLGPDVNVLSRDDFGTYVIKVYRLKEATAESVGNYLQENIPDYASLVVDPNSNQLILYGDVGLARQYQELISKLDVNPFKVTTETFRLAYADATAVGDQIYELFDDSSGAQTQQNQRQPQQPRTRGAGGAAPNPGAATPAGVSQPGPQVQLRVSVNVTQNAVTVSAEPKKVEAIGKLIREQWDLPLPPENAKVYHLKYTDPIKVRDLLQSLLGAGGGSSSTTGGGRAGAPRGVQQNQFNAQGGGGSVSDVIGDIYRIEAFSDQSTVIVISKTKQSLDYLDKVIEAIDQPSTAGLPIVVELKYANAFELADELNILLAESGTGQGLQRPGSGLTAQDNLSSLASGDSSGTGGASGTDAGGQGAQSQSTVEFPWQNAQPRDDQSDPSSLIGKVRIVPIERQNALAILAPVAQQAPVQQLIENFDKPGKQVMISAIVAEVELNDELALGIRLSSEELVSAISDGSVRGTIGFEGTNEGVFGNLFDTSVLNTNVDLNVLIQAISQKTNVRILQEPRVFTADNQEAVFFKGQDVPFVTNTNTSDVSGFQQNIEYQAVGVQLDVRPRITAQRDVNMEINLSLSNIATGQTVAGSFILDRRETTTNVIVKNNQTIVLSGILTDTESSITRGIPLLQDIPWIGELFKSRETAKKTTELIAFITPTVVDNPDENDVNYNDSARDRLRSLALPLNEQAKHQKAIRDRILAPGGADEPILPTAETELDRIREEAAAEERMKEFDRLAKEAEAQGKAQGKKQAEEAAKQLMPPTTAPSEEPKSP